MDIKETITKFRLVDISEMSLDSLNSLIENIDQEVHDLKDQFNDQMRQINEVRRGVRAKAIEIERRIEQELNDEAAKELEERGFVIGSIYYIDRHDGLYVVDSIDQYHICFRRMKSGYTGGKKQYFQIRKLDPRLTPLRTEGPFRVGEMVVRDEKEYKVEGYMGFRMVLSSEYFGQKYFTIIQKKDEKTYISRII